MAQGPKQGSMLQNNLASNPPVAAPKKRVIPKAQVLNDDVDELDDLMGFGGQSEAQPLSKKGAAQERDTLGFLKKSEEEKKRREEEKKNALSQKDAAYKQLSEVTHNLAGYESDSNYPYTMGQNLPATIRANLKNYMRIETVS